MEHLTQTAPNDASTRTVPPAFACWQRIPDGRSRGKWNVAAFGATEAEALSKALSRPTGVRSRDLQVLPAGQEP